MNPEADPGPLLEPCRPGGVEACELMGDLVLQENPQTATVLHERACELGLSHACLPTMGE